LNHHKHDLEVLRNVVILISVYLSSGLLTVVADSTSSKLPYLLSLVTQIFAVLIKNLCTFVLDRELCQVIKIILCRTTTRVMPFNNVCPVRRIQQNPRAIMQTNNQHLRTINDW